MRKSSSRVAVIAAFLLCCVAVHASTLTGIVTNKTNGKLSAGDDVVLIKLQQGMQEMNHTKTDARGRFTIDVPDNEFHLVRVTHDKANYFRPAPPGTQSVEVDVYDVAEKVAGVSTEADVMRIEADGSSLKVLENFFVDNKSTPPRTQLSAHSFEFYLPDGAQIEGTGALAPGGMPVQAPAVPLGDKNHFGYIFPIRPGETSFQVSYRIPYNGSSMKIAPRLATATANLAIILPKTMQFKADSGANFQPVNDNEINAQTLLVRNATPGQTLGFTVAGVGSLPRQTNGQGQTDEGTQQGQATGQSQQTQSDGGAGQPTASTDTRPGGGLGNPIDTPDPLKKYRWWIIAGVAILFAAAAAFLLRKPVAPSMASGAYRGPTDAPQPQPSRSGTGGSLLDALKEELFALETERLEGKLTEEEYRRQKAALETVLKRALDRQKSAAMLV